MHTIKYVGPKPIISHTGIDFDNNKEDKFIYLNIAVQLVKALNHDYFEDKTYVYDASTKRLTGQELIDELRKICPNLDELTDQENHDIEDEIQHNIERAQENKVLNEEERDILETNIEIMHDYLIQRSINKSVYYCVIGVLAELVKKDHIDHIITPMYQSFYHVLHSVQGVLLRQKYPIDTRIDIYEKERKLFVKLQVINTK
jgi:hypothetical protein